MMTVKDVRDRFEYHPPQSEERVKEHERAREAVRQAAVEIYYTLPEGREKSLALTKLEEALFWANASIARQSE